MKQSNICIIPARSGSKGLKDKNIKMFCGRPLMALTIEAALNSKLFDEVMVSTDSELYAEIARDFGATVPFLRSDEMATDKAGTWDTAREVVSKYRELGKEFDTICLLQPTSPMRTSEDIVNAYKIFEERNADAVVGVCPLEHPIKICNTLKENESLDGFFDSNASGRRQDGDKYYRINGAMYIQKVASLENHENLYGERSFAYIMDKVNSVDIDDEADFIMAEALFKKYREEE